MVLVVAAVTLDIGEGNAGEWTLLMVADVAVNGEGGSIGEGEGHIPRFCGSSFFHFYRCRLQGHL